MNKFLFYSIFLFLIWSCSENKNPLKNLIEQDKYLQTIVENQDYEVQIIYSQIDRGSLQQPIISTFSYHSDSSKYFYPASTVKLPASLLALEKINKLNIAGLDKYSKLEIDSAFSRQSKVKTDSTAPELNPSIGHYIRKILITSDNDAYNRLYEFLGQDYFNTTLREKGYNKSRILHRLSISRTPEENLNSNPFKFYSNDSLIYQQQPVKSSGRFYPDGSILKGIGFEKNGDIIQKPFDFKYKNYFPLDEQHQLIQALFFPEQFPDKAFQLSENDYDFIHYNMGLLPGESDINSYQNKEEYWDSFVKFLLYGSNPNVKIPSNIRVFNKIGLAYGYVIDNAYIADFDNGIEFMLSAVIHVNGNEIYNDGVYEYDSTGFPFMAQLGEAVYEMELKRKKNIKPDLKRLENLFLSNSK